MTRLVKANRVRGSHENALDPAFSLARMELRVLTLTAWSGFEPKNSGPHHKVLELPASFDRRYGVDMAIELETKTTQAAVDVAELDRRNRKWLLLSA